MCCGEAQSRPIYQERCGSNDQIYNDQMEAICAELLQNAGLGGDLARTAMVIRVTVEGVFLDMMTRSRDEAVATVYCCAQAFFRKHFSARGLIG